MVATNNILHNFWFIDFLQDIKLFRIYIWKPSTHRAKTLFLKKTMSYRDRVDSGDSNIKDSAPNRSPDAQQRCIKI